nr:SDR family oxidoreductase [Allomuricauda sp.]
MSKSIGVLGCGWLGFPLAKSLLQKGNRVFGTTTSEDKLHQLEMAGITGYQISLSETRIAGDIQNFLGAIEILIINLPPRLRGSNGENYVAKMKLLSAALDQSPVQKILFVGSTSVYGAAKGEVTEDTVPIPTTESGRQLLETEKWLVSNQKVDTTIIRFGGLIGPERNPVTMLSGKKGLQNGNDPINLIHLNDCIHMITIIIEQGYWGQLFNGVYPNHPIKREYYTQEAKNLGIPCPEYITDLDKEPSKTVLSQNFLNKGHAFHTPIGI